MYDVRAEDDWLLRAMDSPKPPLIVNRVYPSDVFASPVSVLAAQRIVTLAEARGIPLLGSLKTTNADYSKLYNARLLAAAGVPTPDTYALSAVIGMEAPFLPAVVKRDTGGYGRGAQIVRTQQRWRELTSAWTDGDHGELIVQRYITSTVPYDWRITIVDGVVIGSYTRTLVDGWMGSVERGSHVTVVRAAANVIDVAMRATLAVDGLVNGADIVVSSDGPVLIESNLTPGFDRAIWEAVGVDPIARLTSLVASRTRA